MEKEELHKKVVELNNKLNDVIEAMRELMNNEMNPCKEMSFTTYNKNDSILMTIVLEKTDEGIVPK